MKNNMQREKERNQPKPTEVRSEPSPLFHSASHSVTSVSSDTFQDEVRKRELEKRKKEQQEQKRLKKQLLNQIKKDRQEVRNEVSVPSSSSPMTTPYRIHSNNDHVFDNIQQIDEETIEDVVEQSPSSPKPVSTRPYVIKQEQQPKEQPQPKRKSPPQYKVSTISFRIAPSGESLTHVFDAVDDLNTVRTWVNMVWL
jgi:hypothetical protein